MDLLFDVVAGGLLTPRLAALGPGDRVLVSDPFGSFVDRPGVSLWVATGTGVAPFVSMARAGLTADKTLVHGSRRADGLYYRSLLTQALGGRYVPCCSAEHGPSVYPGRVTAYLAERAPEPGARHLLCGSAEMVVDVRDLLIARGVPYTRIEAEVYF
jgi:ferredoxin-NADP reductase